MTDNDAHILSYGFLTGILAALLALTGLTLAVAQLNLGAWSTWTALLIAATKSTLVLLFFMHLKYESATLRWMFCISIFTLAIFIGFMFWDLSFR